MGDYQRAAEKVRGWLDLHFDADGRCILDPEDVRFYPKAPYLLHAAGIGRVEFAQVEDSHRGETL